MTDSYKEMEIDVEGLQESADAILEYSDQLEQQEEVQEEEQTQRVAEEPQTKAELEDPRNQDQWGLKALAKEGQSILSGGYKILPLL